MKESLRATLRAATAAAPGMTSHGEAAVDRVVDELVPFVNEFERARTFTPEARSLVWLFGHRMGDQNIDALVVVYTLHAWRDHCSAPEAVTVADIAVAIAVDGYTRGREERVVASVQQRLGDSALVTEAVPGIVLVVAAGPVDAHAAQVIADRAGQRMLRCDARAVLMDWSGVCDPTPAIYAALWGVVGSARMLGAHVVVIGDVSDLASVVTMDASVIVVSTLAEAMDALVRERGVSLQQNVGFVAWAKRLVRVT
jgi:hypothetical protein